MSDQKQNPVIEQGTSCGIEIEAREKDVLFFQHQRQAQIHIDLSNIPKLIEILQSIVSPKQPIPFEYPDTHEGLQLARVLSLYRKVVCVDQWYQDEKLGKGSLGWNTMIPVPVKYSENMLMHIQTPELYYPPFGLNWVLRSVREYGGTMVQLRCLDEKGELCYPDYKIKELLPLG